MLIGIIALHGQAVMDFGHNTEGEGAELIQTINNKLQEYQTQLDEKIMAKNYSPESIISLEADFLKAINNRPK